MKTLSLSIRITTFDYSHRDGGIRTRNSENCLFVCISTVKIGDFGERYKQ